MLNSIQQDLINFEYTREPLLTEISRSLSGYDAIRSVTDDKVLGVFKSNQYVCSHVHAVAQLENAFTEMGIVPEVTNFNLLNNGANLYVHYRLPEAMSIDLGEGIPGVPGSDLLQPEIILRNGLDGKTTFGLEFGLFRLVCSNGMRTMVMGKKASSKAYLGDIDISVIISSVREFCEVLLINLKTRLTAMVANKAPELHERVRDFVISHWSNRLISSWDLEIENIQNQATEAGNQFISEWLYYQSCTYVVTHMMNSYARKRFAELQLAKEFGVVIRPSG